MCVCSINIIICNIKEIFQIQQWTLPTNHSLWHSGTWTYFLCVLSAPGKFLHGPFAEETEGLSGPSISMKEEREIGKSPHSLIHPVKTK